MSGDGVSGRSLIGGAGGVFNFIAVLVPLVGVRFRTVGGDGGQSGGGAHADGAGSILDVGHGEGGNHLDGEGVVGSVLAGVGDNQLVVDALSGDGIRGRCLIGVVGSAVDSDIVLVPSVGEVGLAAADFRSQRGGSANTNGLLGDIRNGGQTIYSDSDIFCRQFILTCVRYSDFVKECTSSCCAGSVGIGIGIRSNFSP